MSTGAVTPSHGSFMIRAADGTTQELDLGTIMMSVNLQYVELLDVQIADQISSTMTRNDQLEIATELLSQLRDLESDGTTSIASYRKITINGETKDFATWCKELGIEYTTNGSTGYVEEDIASLIESAQSAVDSLNNDSETASLQLQNLTEKRSNALQQASNLMSGANNSSQSILRNL